MNNDIMGQMLANKMGIGDGTGALRETVSNTTTGITSQIIGRNQGLADEYMSDYLQNSRSSLHQNITMMDSLRGYSSSPYDANPLMGGGLNYSAPNYGNQAPSGPGHGGMQLTPVPQTATAQPAQKAISLQTPNTPKITAEPQALTTPSLARHDQSPGYKNTEIQPMKYDGSGGQYGTSAQEELEKIKAKLGVSPLPLNPIPTIQGPNVQKNIPVAAKKVSAPETVKIESGLNIEKSRVISTLNPHIVGSKTAKPMAGESTPLLATTNIAVQNSPQPTHADTRAHIPQHKQQKPEIGKNTSTGLLDPMSLAQEKLKKMDEESFVTLISKTAKTLESSTTEQDKNIASAKMAILKREAMRRIE